MRVGIVGRRSERKREPITNSIGIVIAQLAKAFKVEDYDVVIDSDTFETYRDNLDKVVCKLASTRPKKTPYMLDENKLVDIVVVVGGDGTMLEIARNHDLSVPLIGVNQGRLGFITDVPADAGVKAVLEMIKFSKYSQEKRRLLELRKGDDFKLVDRALNEIVFNRGNGRIVEFKVSVGTDTNNQEFAYKVRADGLIINTPTGSTAYALAAGGTIIHPESRVIQVVPMFPQTLAYSPMIVDDHYNIGFELVNGDVEAWVDGQGPYIIKVGERYTVQAALKPVTVWHPRTSEVTYDYWNTLRQKLNWHLEPGSK